jgi:flavin reductase (DIM6/NTAB) family NADH-FMN oxidoreductase RutF
VTRVPAAPGPCGDDARRTAPAQVHAPARERLLGSAVAWAGAGPETALDAIADPSAEPAADSGLVRSILRQHVKGVAVITAGARQPVGFCATSLTSLSLNPPVVSFAVGLHTASWPTVEQAGHAVVHLLADDQQEVARRFARSAAATEKFGPDTAWHRGPQGLPILDDVLGWLLVAIVLRLPIADHALVIGRVVAARHVGDRAPLVHHDGEFVRLEQVERAERRTAAVGRDHGHG